jgi:FkbM family methyltransferase
MAKLNDKRLVVYGFGSVGRHVTDLLIDAGFDVPLILDRKKDGETHRGVPIVSLDGFALHRDKIAGVDCLITLHNHYVDLKEVRTNLLQAGFGQIYSMAAFAQIAPGFNAPNGYWLEPDYSPSEHQERINRFLSMLADDKSVQLARDIIAYRSSGDINLCPVPSEADEYVPVDLPRYTEPLRVIDCGAFTGVALHKLRKADYSIEAFAAFEPDLANFGILASRDFGAREAICLPLATWSSHQQMHFSADSSMGSSLSDAGETVVQCVKVDEVLRGFVPNLVKLDVEGAECETLKGMEKIIRESRPNLCISVYHSARDLFDLALMIDDWGLGYRFHLRVHEQNTFGVVVYARQLSLEV